MIENDGSNRQGSQVRKRKTRAVATQIHSEPYFVCLEEVAGMVERAGLSAEGPPRGWRDVFEDTETPVTELEE